MSTIEERTQFDADEPITRYEVLHDGPILCFLDNLFSVAVWLYEGDTIYNGHIIIRPEDNRDPDDIAKIVADMLIHFAPYYPREFQTLHRDAIQTTTQKFRS